MGVRQLEGSWSLWIIPRQQFFIYDMDEFTKQFYKEVMGEQELGAVPVDRLPHPVVPLQVAPPHSHAWLLYIRSCINLRS